MEDKLYAGALSAFVGNKMYIVSESVLAVSRDEAMGMLIRYCKDTFPVDEGYTNHICAASLVPDDMIERINLRQGYRHE